MVAPTVTSPIDLKSQLHLVRLTIKHASHVSFSVLRVIDLRLVGSGFRF